ncbi:MAG: Hsp20/alpha crystallin family protein [Halobacteriales archaeon]
MSTLRESLVGLPSGVFADLFESDDAYLVVIDLPGATAESTEISADTGRVTIEAHRLKNVPPEFRYEREERPVILDADLPVPPDATAEDASASIDEGVLELRLPKSDDAGREIPVE